MKIKNRFLSLVLAIVFIVPCIFMSACHSHTFAETLTYDETGHWYKATCEHENQKGSFGKHTLNRDGVCTTCGYDQEQYLFNLFKSVKYLPDYTEDYTLNFTCTERNGDIVAGVENVDIYCYKKIYSYDHSVKSAYYYECETENGETIDYEIEYVKHSGDKYLYCYLEQGKDDYYALGDETFAKGICEYVKQFDIWYGLEYYKDFDTVANIMEDIESDLGSSIIEIKDNKNGTFSIVDTSTNGEYVFTIVFNNKKILSITQVWDNTCEEGETTHVDEVIYSAVITSSYDSQTVDSLEFVDFPDASELKLEETSIAIIFDLSIGGYEYMYTYCYEIGTPFSFEHIDTAELEARHLTVTGLYYDKEHTQPVDVDNLKYGFWLNLYATLEVEDGYAIVEYRVTYLFSTYTYPRDYTDCVAYNIETNQTITLPMNFEELKQEGVTLWGYVPKYPENYKVWIDSTQLTDSTNTITVENQNIYHVIVEMLKP